MEGARGLDSKGDALLRAAAEPCWRIMDQLWLWRRKSAFAEMPVPKFRKKAYDLYSRRARTM